MWSLKLMRSDVTRSHASAKMFTRRSDGSQSHVVYFTSRGDASSQVLEFVTLCGKGFSTPCHIVY